MQFKCVDCNKLTGIDQVVLVNAKKDNSILFVCVECYQKHTQTPTKDERKGIEIPTPSKVRQALEGII